jgi:hypothetical protein
VLRSGKRRGATVGMTTRNGKTSYQTTLFPSALVRGGSRKGRRKSDPRFPNSYRCCPSRVLLGGAADHEKSRKAQGSSVTSVPLAERQNATATGRGRGEKEADEALRQESAKTTGNWRNLDYVNQQTGMGNIIGRREGYLGRWSATSLLHPSPVFYGVKLGEIELPPSRSVNRSADIGTGKTELPKGNARNRLRGGWSFCLETLRWSER